MTDKPSSKAFIKLPLDLLTSHAWRSLSLNGRRFVEFLMIEHMRHGGKANGRLLAPRRQLWDFGIGNHYVSNAIEECERAGVVKCQRGVGRRPNLYLITWLPSCDGAAPITPKLSAKEPATEMSANQHSLAVPNSTHKARSECGSVLTKPKNKGIRSALTVPSGMWLELTMA
jgi:hypothetical protein